MDLSVGSEREGGVNEVRDYRKGNWNVQETMVLIEAKKMDEERRMKRPCHGAERGKPPELRWKWVEDYCWKRGCFRSQNQCNDKWDNLMRDFKKVREYEGRAAEAGATSAAVAKSYWKMEKNERKERSLPSNLLSDIYEALMELTEKKSTQRFANVLGQHAQPHQPPPLTQAAPPTHPPQPFPPAVEQPFLASSQPLPTVDCDRSDDSSESESAAKRRKRGEGSSGGGASGRTRLEEVGRAISKSASIIAEAMQSSEERGREMMRVHERRLEIEQSKAEINRRGITSLVDAVNKLADSIFALANQQHSSK